MVMTLEELERTLPNGLHDGEISTILVNYVERRVTMELCAWVSGEIPPNELYRKGTLILEGMQFLVIEPPDPRYKFAESALLWVDVTHERKHLPVFPAISKVPSDCFVSGFFVREWNSFIWVAARDASLVWTGDVYDRDLEKPKPRS